MSITRAPYEIALLRWCQQVLPGYTFVFEGATSHHPDGPWGSIQVNTDTEQGFPTERVESIDGDDDNATWKREAINEGTVTVKLWSDTRHQDLDELIASVQHVDTQVLNDNNGIAVTYLVGKQGQIIPREIGFADYAVARWEWRRVGSTEKTIEVINTVGVEGEVGEHAISVIESEP